MDINSVTSSLRFDDSYIKSLNIGNDNIAFRSGKQRNLSVKFDPFYCGESDGRYVGKVSLSLKMTIPGQGQDKFLIDAMFVGTFSANSSSIGEDQFKKQVAINGGAALYSVARGKIESISAAAFSVGKITIPLINVLDYYKALDSKQIGKKEKGTPSKE